MNTQPLIEIYHEQSPHKFTTPELEVLRGGWQKVACHLSEIGEGEIAQLLLIEISLLPDASMAEVHGEFLADPTPTDVITFEHGELLIGVEVAQRQAKEYEHEFFREVALYGIHGMLHLSGFDDQTQSQFESMKARQEELLALCF